MLSIEERRAKARARYAKNREWRLAQDRQYRQKNLELYRQRTRDWRKRNPGKNALSSKNWRAKYPERYMLKQARRRAKVLGIEFSISVKHILIPEFCPVFSVRLSIKGDRNSTPSLDRIDNSKGYIPGNVWVISERANRLKSNMTLQDLRALTAAVERRMMESCGP